MRLREIKEFLMTTEQVAGKITDESQTFLSLQYIVSLRHLSYQIPDTDWLLRSSWEMMVGNKGLKKRDPGMLFIATVEHEGSWQQMMIAGEAVLAGWLSCS
jgi:hypothetical protein